VHAIDTNVVVRFLTNDDAGQAERARRLVTDNDVFVSQTVLLEVEWVLRAGYSLPRHDVLDALDAFAALPQVRLDQPKRVAKALEWAKTGMDFADALHLAAAEGCESFATFDRDLLKRAQQAGSTPVRQL
jgi:predicted nucleic-acid-binding protein